MRRAPVLWAYQRHLPHPMLQLTRYAREAGANLLKLFLKTLGSYRDCPGATRMSWGTIFCRGSFDRVV